MDALTCEQAATRIQVEYNEMPDLKLTRPQVRRLCDLPADVCDAALDALVQAGFLARVRDGSYLRGGAEQLTTPTPAFDSDGILGPPSLRRRSATN